MNAKKWFTLLLSACLAVSVLSGCKNDDDSSSSSSSGSGSTGGTGSGVIIWPDFDGDHDDGDGSSQSQKYVVIASVGENGTVTVDGKDASKGALTFQKGHEVEVVIKANEGYEINTLKLDGKAQTITDENKKQVTTKIDGKDNKYTIDVTFKATTYSVIAEPASSDGGSVTVANATVEHNQTASITVAVNTGYTATVSATMGGVKVENIGHEEGSNTYTVSNITGDVHFTVTFTATGPTADPSTWEVNANGTLVVPSVVTGTLSKTDVDTALDANDMGRTDLKRVDLSQSGLTEIGESAFAGCNQLIEVVMNNSIKTIGTHAFNTCSNLKTIDLQYVEKIEMTAFYQCNTLKNANLANATYIGESAFEGCRMLQNLQLPKATEIGTSAFNGCTALTSVDLSAAEKIGDIAFGGCTLLSQVYLRDINSFDVLVFDGCNSSSGITIFYGEGGDDAKAALQKACGITDTDWAMTIGFEESQITFKPNNQ